MYQYNNHSSRKFQLSPYFIPSSHRIAEKIDIRTFPKKGNTFTKQLETLKEYKIFWDSFQISKASQFPIDTENLTLFTMWVLVINTNFATAEPRHFEMQKFPQWKFFEKKECLTQDLKLGPQKLLDFDLLTYQ